MFLLGTDVVMTRSLKRGVEDSSARCVRIAAVNILEISPRFLFELQNRGESPHGRRERFFVLATVRKKDGLGQVALAQLQPSRLLIRRGEDLLRRLAAVATVASVLVIFAFLDVLNQSLQESQDR